jgi:adenosylmethionine-8-amino-7-oxononanoate aminotransferase
MGTSLVGMPAMRNGYGGEPFVNEVVRVPALDVEAVEKVFDQRRGEIAAFFGEPVIGAGGVIPPTETYWRDITALCRQYDVLLIADEVITGFGRTGEWWATQRYGIEPDMITFAKGVTSGYMPLGGVLVGERVRAPFWDEPVAGAVFRHGYTYSGHSGAAVAAIANLDIIEREGLVERVRELEPVLDRAVRRLAGAPMVGEIRTVGLTAAVAIDPGQLEKDPATPDKVIAAALRHGVASRVLRGHAVHISPPFVITEDQIDRMVDGIGNALEDVAAAGVPA